MAITSKYIITSSTKPAIFDFRINAGSFSLVGQEIAFNGSSQIDAIFLQPGVFVNAVNLKDSQDVIFFSGLFSDYINAFSGSDSTIITVARPVGGLVESASFAPSVTRASSDLLFFQDVVVNTYDLVKNFPGNIARTPVVSAPITQYGEISGNTILKAISLDSTGENFLGFGAGRPKLNVNGSLGIDKVYVQDGSVVDATNLKDAQDVIYFRGSGESYLKIVITDCP